MWTLAKRQILLVLAGSGRQYRLSWIGYVVACDTNSHLRMPIIYRDLHKTELHTWEDIHSSKSTWPTHHRPAFVEHRPNQMKKSPTCPIAYIYRAPHLMFLPKHTLLRLSVILSSIYGALDKLAQARRKRMRKTAPNAIIIASHCHSITMLSWFHYTHQTKTTTTAGIKTHSFALRTAHRTSNFSSRLAMAEGERQPF